MADKDIFRVQESTLASLKDDPGKLANAMVAVLQGLGKKGGLSSTYGKKLRDAERKQSAAIVVNGKAYKTTASAIQALYTAYDITNPEDQGGRVLGAALAGLRFVLYPSDDPDAPNMTALQEGVLAELKLAANLMGRAGSDERDLIRQAQKAASRFNTTAERVDIPGLQGMPLDRVKKLVTEKISQKAATYTSGPFFGIPAQDLFSSNLAQSKEGAKSFGVAKTLVLAVVDSSNPSAPRYLVEQRINVSTTKLPGDAIGIDKLAFGSKKIPELTGEYKTIITEIESKAAVTKITSSNEEKLDELVEKLRATSQKGVRFVQYGHFTGIQTQVLLELVSVMGRYSSNAQKRFPEHAPAFRRINNAMITLRSFVTVMQKVDSLILKAYSDAEIILPTSEDLKTALKNAEFVKNINIDELTLVSMAGGLVTKVGSLSKKVRLDCGTDVTLYAGPELDRFNELKGRLVAIISDILIKYLESDFEQALTEEDVWDSAFGGSGSDSVYSGIIKQSFDIPVKKGSKKRQSRKVKSSGKKRSKPKNIPAGKAVSVNIPKKPSSSRKIVTGSTEVVTITSTGESRVPNINSQDLLMRLNTIISEEVRRQMTGGSTLQYRTGRFARSVNIQAIQGNSIVYDYMRSPYDVFSQDKGAPPWNSRPGRDPAAIINKAILAGVRNLGELPTYTTRKV